MNTDGPTYLLSALKDLVVRDGDLESSREVGNLLWPTEQLMLTVLALNNYR